jgi:hypothetical protein
MMTIYGVESGKFPRPSNIPAIAQGYGMTTAEFVEILYSEV